MPSDNNVPDLRKYLKDLIGPDLPRGWRFEPYLTALDNLDRPTVIVSMKSIRRDPAAPMARFAVDYTLSVFTQITGVAADKTLDGNLVAFLGLIDSNPNISWSTATQVVGGPSNQYLGFDIATTVYLDKKDS